MLNSNIVLINFKDLKFFEAKLMKLYVFYMQNKPERYFKILFGIKNQAF